ncbi:MAG: hydroxymethylbilane synthase [Elusimicrobiota bacterium]|nr:hydroxymethylbilane synthase [Elusimicrobiota bacterium]
MTVLKMGTRGSPLALAQSGLVARALEAAHPGLKVETVVVKTSGDLFGAPPPEKAKALPQGAKGLWVKEIEEALLRGELGFAVHSAKDLPAVMTPGLVVGAYPKREDARDALVCRAGLTWATLPKRARVGTSSLRRQHLLAAARPDLVFLPLRGNVDTRLRKLAEGEAEAVALAVAGLKRLGRGDAPHEALDPGLVVPAPAQGALALQVRADGGEAAKLVAALDHAATRVCVELERGFLAGVGGGCGAPVAAHARHQAGGLRFDAYFAADGEAAGRRVEGVLPDGADAVAFARVMAEKARAR